MKKGQSEKGIQRVRYGQGDRGKEIDKDGVRGQKSVRWAE